MAHMIDNFFQIVGWDDRRTHDRGSATTCMVYFTHYDLAATLFFAMSTYLSIATSTEDLSLRLYGLLWLFIEFLVIAFTATRFYHRSQFRDMYQRSLKVGIPEDYRWKIETVIKYHFIMSNVFVAIPLLYTISLDWVQMGDSFTFPHADVLPIETTNVTVYVCKYIVYALPVYIAQFELCFLNVTFMYSTGVVKRHFQILDEQVEEAIETEDEPKLKMAIKHHQEVLEFIKDMKTVYEKPILIAIACCGLFIGFTGCIVIQVIQGFIHQILLGLCIASNVVCLITIAIYCIYASNMIDLVIILTSQHNGIMNSLFEHRSCHSRNKSFTRLILMMMTRASLPLEFKVYSIFTINLNLLVKVLKFSYTVLNVLLTSINRKFR